MKLTNDYTEDQWASLPRHRKFQVVKKEYELGMRTAVLQRTFHGYHMVLAPNEELEAGGLYAYAIKIDSKEELFKHLQDPEVLNRKTYVELFKGEMS